MSTQFLHPFASPSKGDFVEIVRGQGALVWDRAGNEYIDAFASLWYCNIGHGRADMAEAIAAQVGKIEAFHCFSMFTNTPAEQAAAEVAKRSPMPDGRVFFACSGSESVDSAIKLARRAHALRGAPERTVIISRTQAYHGVNYGGTSAQGLPPNKEGWGQLLPDVVQVAQHGLDALEACLDEHEGRVAAVLTEPIQGAGGLYPPEPGYLEGLRGLCDRHGALLIMDEVVTGFGRMGTWFGSQHYGVTPDLITFAKGVTSGYVPLGGVILSRALCDTFEEPGFVLRHGFTYSGHPTACAAALKNIEILEDEGLLARASIIGDGLQAGLDELVGKGRVLSVRGAGGMRAAKLSDDFDAAAVRVAMMKHGVITRPLHGNSIGYCPPLVCTEGQIEQCVRALEAATQGS